MVTDYRGFSTKVDSLTEIPIPGRRFAVPASGDFDDALELTPPTFLAGPENRLIATVIGQLIPTDTVDRHDRQPISRTLFDRISPLILLGPSGTGKTHLARGLVECWQRTHGTNSAEHVSASEFRRELIAAIDQGNVADMRRRLRESRLLAIDDLDRLPPDTYLQEELLHLIDALVVSRTLLIVTSSQSVRNLKNLTPAVAGRLLAGNSLRLDAPSQSVRRQLVHRWVAALGRTISTDAADLLASRSSATPRELYGLVIDVTHRNQRIVALSERVVQQYFRQRDQQRDLQISDILRVVAKYYGVPQKVIKSGSRRQSVVLARAMVIFLSRRLANISYERLGRSLGGRDHTTVMHNFRKIDKLAQHDIATQQAVEDLERILLSG